MCSRGADSLLRNATLKPPAAAGRPAGPSDGPEHSLPAGGLGPRGSAGPSVKAPDTQLNGPNAGRQATDATCAMWPAGRAVAARPPVVSARLSLLLSLRPSLASSKCCQHVAVVRKYICHLSVSVVAVECWSYSGAMSGQLTGQAALATMMNLAQSRGRQRSNTVVVNNVSSYTTEEQVGGRIKAVCVYVCGREKVRKEGLHF